MIFITSSNLHIYAFLCCYIVVENCPLCTGGLLTMFLGSIGMVDADSNPSLSPVPINKIIRASEMIPCIKEPYQTT